MSEEVVLNDQAGLHLSAGPYLLFYSQAIPESEDLASALPWMDDIKVPTIFPSPGLVFGLVDVTCPLGRRQSGQ